RLSRQPRATHAREQIAALRASVVIEHRLDPLLPLTTLMRERVPQPYPRSQIEDVLRRDPRLRQPPTRQQLADMPRISTVGLRAPLVPTHRSRLSRLRQMHSGANTLELVSHEPPAGRGLQRDLELLPTEPLTEPPDPGPMRRR